MVGAIYAESKCTIIDTIRDQTKPNQMIFVEFLVFICRIAFEHYKSTVYKNEPLYLKLDHLMKYFLDYPLNLKPLFVFGEKFNHDEKIERKRMKQRNTRLKEQVKREK